MDLFQNFLLDRQYYIKVNDYKSPTYKSAVGIPQGSVISTLLCNVYTWDAIEGVKGLHAEFANDASVVNSDSTVSGACEKANNDLKVERKLCIGCNMSVLDKTEVIINSFDGKYVDEPVRIYMGEKILKVVKTKKVLGITFDNKFSFRDHIQEKPKSGFGAHRSLESFEQSHRGCSPSVYMRLYRSLVLPVVEYGAPVWVSVVTEGCKEFMKIQRKVMLKASECLNSTSSEALEILTNNVPIS